MSSDYYYCFFVFFILMLITRMVKEFDKIFICNIYEIYLNLNHMLNQLPFQYKQRIQKYFTNQSIAQLLIQQLSTIYNSQLSLQNVITISIEGIHLYINFHKISLNNSQSQYNSNPKLSQFNQNQQVDVVKQTKQNQGKIDMESSGCYAIKITKLFPLPNGVRLYILNNCYQPRLFDCRDVLEEVLGMPWKHTNSILDIFTNIDKFQKKLFGRSNQNLAMQMTGQFKLEDTFAIDQLHKFSSMQLFPDLTNQNSTLLSTTQTHLLTLKKIPSPTSTPTSTYQIVRVCNYQCISQLYHNKKESEIIISLNKYRSIKSFDQVQKISRKYILQDTQLFIRNVLKNIGKFQKVQICLQLGSGWSEEKIEKRLGVIREMEGELGEIGVGKKKREIVGQLGQQYQKVIEYFVERANPYYLLYVPKLNKIYELQTTT